MLLNINSIIEMFWLYVAHLIDGFDGRDLNHVLISNPASNA